MVARRVQAHTQAGALVGTERVPLSQLSTTVTYTGTNVSADASDRTMTRATGSWVTLGLAAGMAVQSSGWTGGAAANNKTSRTLESVTALVLTFDAESGADMVDSAAGDMVTITLWLPRQDTLTDILALAGSGGVELQGLTFTSDTGSTADADPGAGLFTWNNATQASATFLYLDDVTADAINLDAFYGALGPSGFLYLQQQDDETRWQLYRWTSQPTDGTGYWKFPVTALAQGAGGAIQDNKITLIDFASSATAAALQGDGLDVNACGTRGIVWNSQTGNYTTVAADGGEGVLHPAGAGAGDTFTIDASLSYEDGTCIAFANLATDAVTIAISGGGASLVWMDTSGTGSRTLAQNGMAVACKFGTTWLIAGRNLT